MRLFQEKGALKTDIQSVSGKGGADLLPAVVPGTHSLRYGQRKVPLGYDQPVFCAIYSKTRFECYLKSNATNFKKVVQPIIARTSIQGLNSICYAMN
jgi:hypothetical protein